MAASLTHPKFASRSYRRVPDRLQRPYYSRWKVGPGLDCGTARGARPAGEALPPACLPRPGAGVGDSPRSWSRARTRRPVTRQGGGRLLVAQT